MKTIIAVFLFFASALFMQAQTGNDALNQKVQLKTGKLKLIEVIGKLDEIKGINITYDANTLPLESNLEFSGESLTAKQVLDLVQKSLPVDYQVKGNYVILKKRKLKYKITGMVTDSVEHEPMAGTNIFIKGERWGVVSNSSGNYSINLLPGEYTLVYRFIGFNDEERVINVSGDTAINIILRPSTSLIQEVKVTSKKPDYYHIDVGRPVQTIDALEMKEQSINNASDVLMARLSGVWATKTSGMPGDHVSVRIRGISSLFGSVDPLYVVDGVSVPIVNLNTLGIADLNVHDIENITVLKDASSEALYGFQGGNGVVMIQTKQGEKENYIEFTSRYGVERNTKYYNLMGTKDFLASMDSSKKKIRIEIRNNYPPYSDSLRNENMQKKIFQDGINKEYQLAGSGSIKGFNYYISGNLNDHSGIIVNSLYKKYSLSASFSKKISDKISIQFGYRGSLQNNKDNLDTYNGNNIIMAGINKAPCIKSDSLYPTPLVYQYLPMLESNVLTDSLLKNTKKLDVVTNLYRFSVKYTINEDLFINGASSLSYRKMDYLSNIPYPVTGSAIYLSSNENVIVINNQLNLNWQHKFGKHEINISAGGKFYTDNAYWNVDSSSFDIETMVAANEAYIRNSMAIHGPGGSVVRNINSGIANLVYNYGQKYFISLAGNFENLKEGLWINSTELFPSIAFNWDAAREFGLNQLSALNHLNIYANWGKTGNYPLNSISDDIFGTGQAVNNNQINNGLFINQLANHQLKPEMVEEHDFGIYIDLFKNSRVIVRADYYFKTNTNLIIQRTIPDYYGGGQEYFNIGAIQNNGKEFSIELVPILTKDFMWFSRFNYSTNNQFIKKLAGDQSIYFPGSDLLFPDFELSENGKMGSIMGYKWVGQWTKADSTVFVRDPMHPKFINIGGLKMLKPDTTTPAWSVKDKVVLGSSIPAYTCNWYNSFTYKNFSISMLWYAVEGVSKYNATRAATYMAGTNSEINSFINVKSSNVAITNLVFYQSSYFVEDASFVRLKELTFSYQPKVKLFNKVGMKFSLSFENLITLTKYKGYDPEASIYTQNIFSDNAVDRGAFPNPKAMYISITLKF